MAVLYGTQSDGSLIPVQADAQGRLVAELAGVDQAVQGDLLVTGNVQMLSLNGGQLAGFRNWIINGNFTVNQRAGTRTPGVGVYGFDRWKGHASGLEQVVEALPAGEYTLSWSGGGDGSFGGATSASPITATVAAGNTSVIVPTTATTVQLEPGPVATPFEHRPLGVELALCQRYFQQIDLTNETPLIYVGNGSEGFTGSIQFPTTMRATPTGSSGIGNLYEYTGFKTPGSSISPTATIDLVPRRPNSYRFRQTVKTGSNTAYLLSIASGNLTFTAEAEF